jgi:hypothetical protein
MVYHKIDVSGLQTLLWDKFEISANNGNSVEEIWNNFKEVVWNIMFHIKYSEKTWTLNTTARNLND